MDTVLGLSVTATNVQTVLVEGRGADGATLGHDEFDVFGGEGAPGRASEQVAEAVLSIAESDGHRLHSIGVTWSPDADLEASLLLDSLADMGLANVVAVQSPRAAEALARSIGTMIGYERTAVCVLEPDAVILSLVDTHDGEIDTAVSYAVDSEDQLVAWIRAGLQRHDWRPEGLFLVGSVGGLDALATLLQDELGVPVFDPPEAELALAHGAALASAADPQPAATANGAGGRWPVVPLTMLVAGAVTFVVAVSLAVSPHLIPRSDTHRDTAVVTKPTEGIGSAPIKAPSSKAQLPSARPAAPARPAVPAEPPAAPAPPPAAPVPPPPPAQALPAPEPAAPAPAPAPAAPPAQEAPPPPPPVVAPVPTIEAITPAYPPAPVVEPINPIQPPPPVVAPVVPQVPEKPRLRDRIIDKIPGLNRFN